MPTYQNNSTDAARLRAEIDAGRHGDKVAASDPAMSPLGTDDEAAGHSTTHHMEPPRYPKPEHTPQGQHADHVVPPQSGFLTALLACLGAALAALIIFALT